MGLVGWLVGFVELVWLVRLVALMMICLVVGLVWLVRLVELMLICLVALAGGIDDDLFLTRSTLGEVGG